MRVEGRALILRGKAVERPMRSKPGLAEPLVGMLRGLMAQRLAVVEGAAA